MKSSLLIPAILIFALTAACSGDSKDEKDRTVTAATPARSPVVSPSPMPIATPVPRTRIAPENIRELRVQAQGMLTGLEGLNWSADSTQLLVYNRQSIVAIDNKEGGQLKPLASVTAPEQITDVSASGSFVSRLDERHFNLRRIDTGSVIKNVQTETPFINVVLSRDGSVAAVQRQDKVAVDLYQLPAGTLLKQLSGFETAAPAFSVRFTLDSKYLVWHARAQVQFQDIATGVFGPQLRHEDFVSAATLRPSGNAIATSSGKTVSIWDPGSGVSQQVLEQEGIVSGLAFSPDSNLLAVSTDAGLTLWDAKDPAAYTKIETKPGAFKQLSFSPDGTALGTADTTDLGAIWTRQGPTK